MSYEIAYYLVAMIAAIFLCLVAWPTPWLVSIGVITFIGGVVGLLFEASE